MTDPKTVLMDRDLAAKTLRTVAKHTTKGLQSFSSWLLGGLGAALTFLVVNIEKISKFLEVSHIRSGLILFVASLVCAVLAKYIGVVVAFSLEVLEDAEELGKQRVASHPVFDVDGFAAEYERGLYPPIRFFARRAMNKAKSGDIALGARMLAKFAQIYAVLVLIQCILAFAAVGTLATGLKAP